MFAPVQSVLSSYRLKTLKKYWHLHFCTVFHTVSCSCMCSKIQVVLIYPVSEPRELVSIHTAEFWYYVGVFLFLFFFRGSFPVPHLFPVWNIGFFSPHLFFSLLDVRYGNNWHMSPYSLQLLESSSVLLGRTHHKEALYIDILRFYSSSQEPVSLETESCFDKWLKRLRARTRSLTWMLRSPC